MSNAAAYWQLVDTIKQQADAFREGLEEVTGAELLGWLSADELQTLWAGQAIDDEKLEL